ncbi:hypothetical protein B0I26_10764 [Anoxybacillus vitaminiphilus]|uniref:HTH cro/C1-type domain-containing protein n=1 Tax=Paranoxybacillus vitaminiphilus TaxID=581036 RepID=A0A327YFA5_9BACL|nr:hypothetical protein B0I26_10764 [Anoxybacillus vitaminiphilus]
MKYVISQIEQELERKEISKFYLARMLNLTVACINECFRGTRKFHFRDFLRIVHLLFDDKRQQHRLIAEYCLSSENKEDVREAMEWASNNGFYELLFRLIDIYPSNFSDLYSLLLKRNQGQLSPIQFYNELEMIKFKMGKEIEIPETQVLIKILSMYSFLDLHSYSLILPIADHALNLSKQIMNYYIRESYMMRIKEIMAIHYMKQLQLENAVRIAREIINISNFDNFPLSVNFMLCLLAEMYVYSDYHKSIYYIEKAIEHFNRLELSENFMNRKHMLLAVHDFIKITNGVYQNLYLLGETEQAYYLSVQPDKESKERAL